VTKVAGLNIRIPDDLHRRAKSAAALKGQSLTDYVIEALEAATPPQDAPAKPAKRPRR
jgi:predicted HicB family RNase H-like nuclease